MAVALARRSACIFFLLLLPLLLEAQAGPTPRPYALQEIQLGAPLSEVRRLRFVEEGARNKLRLLCSNDAESAGIDLLHPLATALRQDEIRCALFEGETPRATPTQGTMQIFGESVRPLLLFYPPDDGGEAHLAEIIVRFDSGRFQQIVAFMRRAYGPPDNYQMTGMQSVFGEMVDATYYWNNDVSSIEADSITLDLDKMSVVFKLTELAP